MGWWREGGRVLGGVVEGGREGAVWGGGGREGVMYVRGDVH